MMMRSFAAGVVAGLAAGLVCGITAALAGRECLCQCKVKQQDAQFQGRSARSTVLFVTLQVKKSLMSGGG